MKDIIIVGAGHRAVLYAEIACMFPDRVRITGVADPNPLRRQLIQKKFGFPADRCFADAAELARAGKLADAVINGTMDADHVPTSLLLLEAGYDILLEKPFATSAEEALRLHAAVKQHGRQVMICHVLRYAPFYAEIKKLLLAGRIGKVISLQTDEHVSYHHIANCFVRGKWNSEEACRSTMLMAKCCHDLDLIAWIMSGIAPRRVASFGGRHFFNRANAPAGSGEFCLLDCPLTDTCDYSCKRLNLGRHTPRWGAYSWAAIEHLQNPTQADYEQELRRTDNPYARCVWKSDNTVVDRQAVMIEFADGATATHNMVGGTARPCRKIHVIGTRGEIEGVMDDNRFTLRQIVPETETGYSELLVDLNQTGDTTGAFGGHGGGDLRLAEDFLAVISGFPPSISCTSIEDSLNGHLIGFAADLARRENRVIEFNAD